MIVGGPIAGKSSAFKVLAKSLGDMKAQGLMEENKVRIRSKHLVNTCAEVHGIDPW